MRRLKKMIAGILTGCLIATSHVPIAFAAEEPTTQQDVQEDTQEADTPEVESDESQETNTDTDAIAVQEANDLVGNPVETGLLNYIVVESDYVQTPDTQYVLADISATGTIGSAELVYTNQTTGSTYEKSVDVISDSALLFNLSFENETSTGVYKLKGIKYTVDEQEQYIDLEAAGASDVFGVNVTADSQPDAWIVDETAANQSADEAGITVTDVSSGETISGADVAEAISELQMNNGTLLKSASNGNLVVVLDPGHGGSDCGTYNTINGVAYYERDINLKIAYYCKEELDKYSGITVYMARTDNHTEWSSAQSVELASKVGADVMVSLHVNSAGPTARGALVIVPNSNYRPDLGQIGGELGKVILSKLSELGLYNRGNLIQGSKDNTLYPDGSLADYYSVCRRSKLAGFPGIIIEHAFLSNPDEAAKYLTSDTMLQKLGVADATAIAQYYGLSTGDGTVKPVTVLNGVDYSAVYDYDYYVEHNADVKAAFGTNTRAVLQHFVNYGMKEGRRASADFDVKSYRNQYADLRRVFGINLQGYYLHYINYGKREGRKATGVATLQNPTTVYNGVNYSAVYDYAYYTEHYKNELKSYIGDDLQVLQYFVNVGMSQGQQGSADFDVNSYRNAYRDLRSVYGSNLKNYYLHYISYGKNEHRKAIGVATLQNATTVYNGVNYSAVYDYTYYIQHNRDVYNVFGGDENMTLQHFVNYGMKEGRQGKADFDVRSYKNAYVDLRNAFGADLKNYYLHYMNYGRKEGRKATGVTKAQNPTTVYNGTNYSAVYDYTYYIEHHPDILKKYSGDDLLILQYFVTYGMKEGQQAKDSFDVNYYRNRYGDLNAAFGDNLQSYYSHYMRYGIKEQRRGSESAEPVGPLYSIMGTSSTNVNQMVAYYNSRATYPAFYANSDAPTINDFCRIYIEECNAEGVRAEVAFAQAMKETGFLKFGGLVQIDQYNFAGLGATGPGFPGERYDSVRTGIRAQVQHLKAYASKDALKNTCVDSRFQYVTRGCAQYVEWLGIKENPNGKGWATATNYGYSIVNDYIAKLLQY